MKRNNIRKIFILGFVFSLFLVIQTPAFASLSTLINVGKLIEDLATAPPPAVGAPLFAVAPFHTNDPSDPSGSKIQKQVEDLLKTIWPDAVIKKVPRPALDAQDAQKLLEQLGLDWLLWGTQEEKTTGSLHWTYGICFSDRYKGFIKKLGFGDIAEILLKHVPDPDLTKLLKFSLKGSTLLVQATSDKPQLEQIRAEIEESDELFDSVQNSGLDASDLQNFKQEQAGLLMIYGLETGDLQSKRRAKKIFKELVEEVDAKSEKKHEYEMGLGMAEMQLGEPVEAVEAFEKALAIIDPNLYPVAWLDNRVQLGTARVAVGTMLSDYDDIQKGVQELEEVLTKLDKKTQLLRWVSVQNSLGLAYQILGSSDTKDKYFQLSLDHLLEALRAAKGVLGLGDIATIETNLSSDYSSLGQRQRNVDYLNQAVVTARGAVETYRTLKNDLKLVFAMFHLSAAQSSLGEALDDMSSLRQAKATLEDCQRILPADENKSLWATNQMLLSELDKTITEKTFDPAALKEGLDRAQAVKAAIPEMAEKNPDYYLLEGEMLCLKGLFSCDLGIFQQALTDSETSQDLASQQKNTVLVLQTKMLKAGVLDTWGYLTKDPKRLHDSITLSESVLDDLTKEGDSIEQCSMLSMLCDTYGDLLEMETTPQDLTDAGQILERFKVCKKAEFPGEAASHLKCEAEVTYGLAAHGGDLEKLNRALELCREASVFYRQKGYTTEEAIIQQLVGRIDLTIGEKTKKPETLRQAIAAFTNVEEAFKGYGPCVRTDSEEGLQKAKSLLNENASK